MKIIFIFIFYMSLGSWPEISVLVCAKWVLTSASGHRLVYADINAMHEYYLQCVHRVAGVQILV